MRYLLTIALLCIGLCSWGQTPVFTITYESDHCQPVPVTLSDVSAISGTIVSRIWDFGEGSPVVMQANKGLQAGHNYELAGKYPVTLTLVMSDGRRLVSAIDTIRVYPSPVADFTIIDSSGCPTLLAKFTDMSTSPEGAVNRWQWAFDGFPASTSQTPLSINYTSNGLYAVKLFVWNEFGCKSETKTKYVDVHSRPSVAFNALVDNTCDPATKITLTNNTTGTNDINYKWDFGDGNTSVVKDTIYEYASPGRYTITLTASNGANCLVGPISKTLYIGTPLLTLTSTDKLTICTNQTPQFTATFSPASLLGYVKWLFPDNNTSSTGTSVNHKFTTAGTFDVKVVAVSQANCPSDTSIVNVSVLPSPVAKFDPPKTLCAVPGDISLTNNSTPVNNDIGYYWNFADGSTSTLQNPTHTYTAENTGNVKLVVTDNATGCKDSTTQQLNIKKPSVTLNVTPQSGCELLTVTATATPTANEAIDHYDWDWGDGTTSTTTGNAKTHPFSPGTYNITVTITTINGCTATSAPQTVVVADECPPPPDDSGGGGGPFGFGNSCENKNTFKFTDPYSEDPANNSTIVSVNFGDGTPTINGPLIPYPYYYTYSGSGTRTYTVTLVRKNTITNKITTVTQDVTIIDEKAAFTITTTKSCTQATYTFTPNGITSKYIRTYAWNFGELNSADRIITNNGGKNNGQTTHLYDTAGTYTVRLIITDMNNCVDSIKYDVTLSGPYKADFIGQDSFSCKETSFEKSFTYIANSNNIAAIVKWDWYVWPTGGTVPSSPTRTFTTTDDYTIVSLPFSSNTQSYQEFSVKLVVTDENGCQSVGTTHSSIVRRYWPKAGFSVSRDSMCGIIPITFYNNSSAKKPIYQWDFGDNTTSLAASPSPHTYPGDGKYDVSLIVTEQDMPTCKDTIEKNGAIKIIKPKADFSIQGLEECPPLAPGFINASTNASAYLWMFSDGEISTLTNIIGHIYDMGGSYEVTLVAKGIDGCTDTLKKAIQIRGPAGKLTNTDSIGCAPFKYSMSISQGLNISKYAWDFNAGSLIIDDTALATTQTFTYNMPGTYKTSVIISSTDGCKLSLKPTTPVIVDLVNAKFDLDKTSFCGNGIVSFTNNSTAWSGSSIQVYSWDFGDGTTSTLASPPQHEYSQANTYNVVLAVKSKYGCMDTTAVQHITVYNNPVAAIDGKAINCLQTNVSPALHYTYSGTSIDPIVSYVWKVDNANVSNGQNLDLDFRISGAHNVQLIVLTNNNCADSVIKQFIIDSVYADFSVLDSIKCGDNKIFDFINNASSAYPMAEYIWQFGDGETGNASSTQHTYANTGNYAVTLQVTTENNCVDQVTKQGGAIIYNKPTVTLISDTAKCLKDAVNYSQTVVSDDVIAQQGLYIYDITNNRVAFPLPSGTYTMAYVVQTAHGCMDSAVQSLTIHPLPALVLSNDSTICKNTTITLSVSGGTSYLWTTDGNTFIQDATVANPIITPATDAHYFVHATNQFGCTSDSSIFIRVNDPVDLSASPPVTICEGYRARLWVKGNTSTFLWNNAASLSNAQSSAPFASPQITTNYVVKGFSNNVCPDEIDSVLVTVVKMPAVNLGPDITTLAGTPVTLQPSVTGNISSYSWNPATGLSCSDCANPTFTASANTTYSVVVSTNEGCKASDDINIYVLCNKSSVYIPDAFTPNGDGKNDVFYIMGYGILSIKNFSVFDRWGKMVFQKQNCNANDRSAGWNGLVDGKPVSQSTTFVYTAEIICAEGKSVFFKGTVVLIR